MIIKSLSRKSNGTQLIQYVLRYSLKENLNQRKQDATIILRHHIRSIQVQDIIKEYKQNEYYRIYHRSDSVKLFHDILSFAPSNKQDISKATLTDIARKYVELRSVNTPCLVIHHAEKNHDHLHCIVAGVKLDGYSSRISKQQFQHLKVELERYQQEKYPELAASTISHNGTQPKTREAIVQAVQHARQTNKQKLLEILQQTFTNARSQSDFIRQLRDQQYEPYYRNNRLQGVMVNDRKFRFSGLGYDESKWKELESREADEKALAELADLRKGTTRHLQKEKGMRDSSLKMLQPLPELDELRILREQSELRQTHQRFIDLDTCDPPRVISIPGISEHAVEEDSDLEYIPLQEDELDNNI